MVVAKNLFIMLLGAVIVFGVTLFLWSQARAEEEAQPRWKIVVLLDGPPGKQELTYGNQQDGPHWFKTKEECEAARRGGDKKFAEGMVKLHAQIVKLREQKVPIEVSTACKVDDSV